MKSISVIIPVYKVEDYLNQCIESITSQWSDQTEIILVDDGSPDNCPQICDQWAERETRIRVIHKENGGLSAARNSGMELAKGDYVWFVDSDDWLELDAFKVLAESMVRWPDADVYATGLNWRLNDKIIKTDIEEGAKYLKTGIDFILQKYPKGASQRFVLCREFLQANNLQFLPGVIHEDGHFALEMLYLAKGVVIMDNSIYSYRQREEGSIMHSLTMRSAYDCITIHKDLMRFMQERLPNEEWDIYRFYCRDMLMGFYSYIRHLLWTEDYRKFYNENGNYIKSELKKCIPMSTGMSKWRIQFFIIFPRLSTIAGRKISPLVVKMRYWISNNYK